MDDVSGITGIPDWVKWVGGGLAAIGAAALYLPKFISAAKVDRAADDANVATINRLQAELDKERARADALMKDREAMIAELGQLRGEVKGLREQVEMLTALVSQLREDERA